MAPTSTLTVAVLAASLFVRAAHAQDSERPPSFAGGANEVPCDLWSPLTNVERCDTPREGVLSGFYLAFDVGAVELNDRTEERVGVGPGPVFQFRIGFGFWDHLLLSAGLGGLYPSDERSTTEEVVDCYYEVCDEARPYAKESSVGTEYLAFEVGSQHRFRPVQGFSISLGGMLGFLEPLRALNRGVECEGCSSTALDAEAGGYYVAPYVRLTFGRIGELATILRSQWFLTGDLLQATTLGIEYGLP